MVEADKAGSDFDDDSDEVEEVQISQAERDASLMKAVQANDFDAVVDAIKNGADVQYEENGWNSLLWAACNGNEDIVRILIKN